MYAYDEVASPEPPDNRHLPTDLQIPTSDMHKVRVTSSHFMGEQQLNLPSSLQLKVRPLGFNTEAKHQKYSQLTTMGVLGGPRAEVQELYPELSLDVEHTYEAMSDEGECIYDDVSELQTLYVNISEVQETRQTQKKAKPVPPPRTKKSVSKLETAATPKTNSFGGYSTCHSPKLCVYCVYTIVSKL